MISYNSAWGRRCRAFLVLQRRTWLACLLAWCAVFTSDHALKLEWVPSWVAIIGSGYIGLEFSDVYTALGSEVRAWGRSVYAGRAVGGSPRYRRVQCREALPVLLGTYLLLGA